MIELKIKKTTKQTKADLLCLFSYQTTKTPEETPQLDASLKKKVTAAIDKYPFDAKEKETLLLEGNAQFNRILIIGLGKKSKFTKDSARTALHLAVKQANQLKADSLACFPLTEEKFLQPITEGLYLADYQFEGFHQKKDKDQGNKLREVTLITKSQTAAKVIKETSSIFQGVNLSKDLVNLPANIVTPSYLENEARNIAKASKKVKLEVLSEQDAAKLKMGAFLAVAKGSKEPAKMIVLRYDGNPKSKTVFGIVGKGITFDSGGISLKGSAGMDLMKTDMAGSAAVLGTMKAVSKLELKVNLIAVVAATENMPGGNAYRPGDIITASNGKTIEVLNTDAEGRMVLADALVYAQKKGATKIIDIATLTGACIVTFGYIYTGLMSNDDDWTETYLKASKEAGEKTWALPMGSEYDNLIKSDIADMANTSGSKKAGSIAGGKFLEQFIEKKTAWIHLDIAGTSYLESPVEYLDKQATGTPVRTLVALLKREEKTR